MIVDLTYCSNGLVCTRVCVCVCVCVPEHRPKEDDGPAAHIAIYQPY